MPEASAGKYTYGSKRVENMQTVLSADGYATSSSNVRGKYAVNAECGKICNWC